MSISYNILRDLGGSLTARNRPEGGACFTLTLPKAESSRAETTADDVAFAPPPRKAAR